MATVPTTTGTYLASLFDPEVIADILQTKLTKNMVFAPLARIDYTLEGRPGDTVKLPYYSYIGKATSVAEGTDIPIAKLVQTATPVQVQKFGRAVQITDEAAISGYGDPIGEATSQLGLSLDDAMDDELLAKLAALDTSRTVAITAPSDIPNALVKFGENIEGEKAIVVPPSLYADLIGDNWIPASEIAAEVKIRGSLGMAYGCQVVVSERLTTEAYIVKPGALAVFMKRSPMIETDRDILNQSTVIAGSIIAAPYLLDPNGAVKLTL